MSHKISPTFETWTAKRFINVHRKNRLNLSPGFQRQSVWTDRDKSRFIESMLDGYPVPSIYLYKDSTANGVQYQVLDGKQRLEALLAYVRAKGFKNKKFDFKYQFSELSEPDKRPEPTDWNELKRLKLQRLVTGYKFQVIQATGDLEGIHELFVRINSTGKRLTGQERRRARHLKSPLLKEAEKVSRKLKRIFREHRIISEAQASRMKDVELVCELLESIRSGGPINKKKAIDAAIANAKIHEATLAKAGRQLIAAVKATHHLLPKLMQTRFRNHSDYYSLVLVIWEMMHSDNFVLTDAKARIAAEKVLMRLSNAANELQIHRRTMKPLRKVPGLIREYLMAVERSADDIAQRRVRGKILHGLLDNIFEPRDRQRLFSPQQRSLLWNSAKMCKCSKCAKRLDWNNFQVDHLHPWSKGGATDLSNAALICRSCNSQKGNRA